MKAHLLWHALKDGSVPLAYPASGAEVDKARARQRFLAPILASAHKFEAEFAGLLDDDALDETATELWRAGVLKPPFDDCYFEISGPPSSPYREGVLVRRQESGRVEGEFFVYRGETWIDPGFTWFTDYGAMPSEGALPHAPPSAFGDWDSIFFNEALVFSIKHVIDLCCVMGTKHAALEHVPAPERLNAQRADKGRPPLFEYRILTIDMASAERAEGEGTHASPRLHWRRGHVRSLEDGRKIAIKPCLVGVADRGVISKDYRVAAPAGKKDETPNG